MICVTIFCVTYLQTFQSCMLNAALCRRTVYVSTFSVLHCYMLHSDSNRLMIYMICMLRAACMQIASVRISYVCVYVCTMHVTTYYILRCHRDSFMVRACYLLQGHLWSDGHTIALATWCIRLKGLHEILLEICTLVVGVNAACYLCNQIGSVVL